MRKNLVLLGMMAVGKTTAAKIVAKKLNLEFIDIDKVIEDKEKLFIYEIFKNKGESYFRKVEEKITIKMLNKNNTIVSLGGGGFINKNIQKIVLKENLSIWLDWKSSTLVNRIIGSKKRPLAVKNNKNKIEKLISDRSEIYSKANFKINCEIFTKNEIINKIVKIYENN